MSDEDGSVITPLLLPIYHSDILVAHPSRDRARKLFFRKTEGEEMHPKHGQAPLLSPGCDSASPHVISVFPTNLRAQTPHRAPGAAAAASRNDVPYLSSLMALE
ncbi:unnamed protein product [Pleuronectes platessa]|uniref:Uncharacterized protein n=1 Tax=Pleuronectes platessa TaxID=8262 RepID=A0A9N7W5P4_PLEPL|nr:unnamed protein product [Pleuronectes platessa]